MTDKEIISSIEEQTYKILEVLQALVNDERSQYYDSPPTKAIEERITILEMATKATLANLSWTKEYLKLR